ncbi:hypothetical protein D1122_03440 [Cereibacter sphaeroides]|nr:hypothetical protein D1122_03440 [Cereibacter sphaeroides]
MIRTWEARRRGPANLLREGISGARPAHHPDVEGAAQRSGQPPVQRCAARLSPVFRTRQETATPCGEAGGRRDGVAGPSCSSLGLARAAAEPRARQGAPHRPWRLRPGSASEGRGGMPHPTA